MKTAQRVLAALAASVLIVGCKADTLPTMFDPAEAAGAGGEVEVAGHLKDADDAIGKLVNGDPEALKPVCICKKEVAGREERFPIFSEIGCALAGLSGLECEFFDGC